MEKSDLSLILKQKKGLILLTEIIGWLHDIDKLDELHDKGHRIRAAKEFGIELCFEPDSKEFGIIDTKRFQRFREFFQEGMRLIFPQDSEILDDKHTTRRGSPVLYHHTSKGYPPRSIWEWIICGSDSRDSREDRQNVGSNPTSKMASSPFGNTRRVPTKNLRNRREELYCTINAFLGGKKEDDYSQLRQFMIRAIWNSFNNSVADTHYPVNDVGLLDHSYMTGAIAKSVLLEYLLDGRVRSEIKNTNDINAYIRNKLKFQSLSVIFSSRSYLLNTEKLADLIGRVYLYNEIRKNVKELLESTIPIGSSIYEDMDCIIFLVPELKREVWKVNRTILRDKIRDRILETLSKEITPEGIELDEEELSSIIMSLNPRVEIADPEKDISTLVKNGIQESRDCLLSNELSECSVGNVLGICSTWENIRKEKCQVCDLLPRQVESEKLCTICSILRDIGRYKARAKNIGIQKRGVPESIWLDEIKDENNVLAFIVGKITPIEKWLEKRDRGGYVETSTFMSQKAPEDYKNLSASRARAIWRTVDQFTKRSAKIKKTEAYGCVWRIREIPNELSSRFDDNPSVSILFENETIEAYVHSRRLELETVNALKKEFAEKLFEQKTAKVRHNGDVFELRTEQQHMKHFYTSRTIYSYAGEFISILPAKDAIEVVAKIRNKFKSFNRVSGRLSLNLGIVYFKHKSPLYTALDSAKRMLNDFSELSRERICAQIVGKDNKPREVKLTLNINEKEIEWVVNAEFPDGQHDIYYPYFFLLNKNVKYVREIQDGDLVSLHPSYFDFEFLDTITRRFDMILESGKRPHKIFNSGPRPYYLEEVDTFKNMWDFFCGKNAQGKKITSSQIQNFQNLLISKIEEWDLKNVDDLGCDTFKTLIEDSITRILGIQRKIEKDGQAIENRDFNLISKSVSSGLFFDVFELYVTIMKQKPEGDENEQS
jgi:hypothetical protein